MKIKFYNLRLRCNRDGIEFYPLPTIQCVLNEYGYETQPNWEIRIWWIWFCLSIRSKKCGKKYFLNKSEKNYCENFRIVVQ